MRYEPGSNSGRHHRVRVRKRDSQWFRNRTEIRRQRLDQHGKRRPVQIEGRELVPYEILTPGCLLLRQSHIQYPQDLRNTP